MYKYIYIYAYRIVSLRLTTAAQSFVNAMGAATTELLDM